MYESPYSLCIRPSLHVISSSLTCIQVVESADVVLEILDARDPLGCRSVHVERAVMANSSKKLVLVLNKIDLVPKEVR